MYVCSYFLVFGLKANSFGNNNRLIWSFAQSVNQLDSLSASHRFVLNNTFRQEVFVYECKCVLLVVGAVGCFCSCKKYKVLMTGFIQHVVALKEFLKVFVLCCCYSKFPALKRIYYLRLNAISQFFSFFQSCDQFQLTRRTLLKSSTC